MGVKIGDDFTGGGEKPSGHPSAASQLVELALQRYQFGVTQDGQPYAIRPGRHVVRILRGGKDSLRAELSQAYYQKHKKAPPQQALADALLVLEGMAQDQDPDQVHLRVAATDGVVWLDLGNAAETAVRIDANGWQVVRDGVPVLFRRTGLTGALPEPRGADHTDHTDHNSYLSLRFPRFPGGSRSWSDWAKEGADCEQTEQVRPGVQGSRDRFVSVFGGPHDRRCGP
ncbi:MAG TPA: hypothetical protein VI094_00715 [Propionibacteriaceae bacterium]